MGSSEKFCLKIMSPSQDNVTKSFSKLRQESGLFDVTLVGSDQKQLSAHRLVLSACSDFFKTIFHSNTHSHPLLYLDGVDHAEINLMLDYIYQGEVQIYQEHLDRFLEVAKKFKLDGLMAAEVEGKSEPIDNNYHQFEEIHEAIVDPAAKAPSSKKQERSLRVYNETFEANNSEVEKKFIELIVKENKMYRCTVCDKTQTDKTKMRLHLETHLTGLSYDCPTCGKNFRSRNAFNTHISREHNKV